jgi:hypothetical protein
MNIEGKKVTVNKSVAELFAFLSEYKNFESIMPSDVSKFESDDTSFVFGIKGFDVRLIKKSSEENKQIVLEAASSKLSVELTADFEDLGDKSTCKLTFVGDFNPMVKMMVQKPLDKFISDLTENIEKL